MSDPRRDRLIQEARARLNVPYGLPPGPGELDCSLYILEVCKAAGMPIRAGVRTAEQIRAVLVPIDFADVLPGDILTFEHTYDDPEPSAVGDGHVATHIGLSLGAATHKMLNALEPVSAETNIGTSYWQSKILSAGRLPQLEASVPSTDLPWGVDVASHQGAVDWAAVAAAGAAFSWTKATGGAWYTNPTFSANWHGMKAAGLARGCYHYAFEPSGQPLPGPGPEVEAEYFVGRVMAQGLEAGDLLALDLEEGNGNLGDWTSRFVQHVTMLVGFSPLVYTSAGFANGHGLASRPELGSAGLWLASWQDTMPAAPAPWDLVAFWQWTNATSVPGVSGPVDGDRFNGPADRIRLYGKPGTTPPPPPTPDPLAEVRLRLQTIRDQAEAALAALGE